MGFFKSVLAGMVVGGVLGFLAFGVLLPLDWLSASIAVVELPLLGAVNRLVLFGTGMAAVIGGGLTAVLVT